MVDDRQKVPTVWDVVLREVDLIVQGPAGEPVGPGGLTAGVTPAMLIDPQHGDPVEPSRVIDQHPLAFSDDRIVGGVSCDTEPLGGLKSRVNRSPSTRVRQAGRTWSDQAR